MICPLGHTHMGRCSWSGFSSSFEKSATAEHPAASGPAGRESGEEGSGERREGEGRGQRGEGERGEGELGGGRIAKGKGEKGALCMSCTKGEVYQRSTRGVCKGVQGVRAP